MNHNPKDSNPETIEVDMSEVDDSLGEVEDPGYPKEDEPITVEYSPQDPVSIETTENTPEWLVYQVNDMRSKSDEVHDFLDIYDRFTEEEWEEMPSEVEGFLSHHGYDEETDEDPMTWLIDETAQRAVELCEQRDLVTDVFHGIDKFTIGEMSNVEKETVDKIQSEVAYANTALLNTKSAGATTEGGYTKPHPIPDVDPEHSLGHQYAQKLEEAAEEVDWHFERRAYWD